MRNGLKIAASALLLAAALNVTACRNEGPAERAGKKIDNAVDKAEDAVDDAVD